MVATWLTLLILSLAVVVSLQTNTLLIILNIFVSLIEIIRHITFIGVNISQIFRLIYLNLINFILRLYLLLAIVYLWQHRPTSLQNQN